MVESRVDAHSHKYVSQYLLNNCFEPFTVCGFRESERNKNACPKEAYVLHSSQTGNSQVNKV